LKRAHRLIVRLKKAASKAAFFFAIAASFAKAWSGFSGHV
jgi:hypothetical protein